MFNSFKAQKKVVAIWSLFSIVLNMAQPAFLALSLAPIIVPSNVSAQELLPSDSPEPTVTPTESPTIVVDPTAEPSSEPSISPDPTVAPSIDPTPSPTPDATLTPSATPEATVSPSVEPTPTPNTDQPANPAPPSDSSPAPPADSNTPTPTPTPSATNSPDSSTTPTPTQTPDLNEKLNISIVDNKAASSIEEYDLTVTESGSATLATDKADYAPTDTAIITGAGFLANTTYKLVISSTDAPATSTTVDVRTDSDGTLFYAYQLDGVYRPNYKVEAYLGSSVVATITFTDSYVSGSYLCDNDAQGANDEPGQKDLTKMCVNDSGLPNTIQANWNWDETGWSGNNTGDSCALFDTDNDGLANFASCVTVEGNLATQKSTSPRIFTCNDSRADRCAGPGLVAGPYISSCAVNITSDQPFVAGDNSPNDTQASCTVQMSEVGGSGVADLIDVCSFPSDNPNSDPSDCIFAKPNAGKLEVIKILAPTNDPGLFNLLIDGVVIASNVGNNGTTGENVVSANSHVISETAGTNTSLTNYSSTVSCRDLNGTGSVIASSTNSGTVSVNIADGSDVVCLITNTRINNASLTIIKDAQPNDSQDFAFTTTGAGLFDFNLDDDADATLSNTVTFSNLGTGTYSVSESSTTGWDQTSATCSDGSLVSAINISSGEIVTCTFTNTIQPAHLTLVKSVTNDNGGSATPANWTLTATGPTTISGLTGAAAITNAVVSGGTYTLSESAGPAGYTPSSWSCVKNTDAPVVGSSITLAPNDSATCTINNDDNAPALHLRKTVTNDNGGTAVDTDWTLTATGTLDSPTNLSGTTPVDSDSSFKADTYTLSETGPVGYTGTWNCGNATMSDSTHVTVPFGADVTCTINNNDNAAHLIVVKHVINNNGGTAGASSFTTTITGVTTTTPTAPGSEAGINNTLTTVGSYSVDEGAHVGYTKSLSTDCSGTIALGETKTCTITNDDIPAELTVIKHIINNNGGNRVAADFTMLVTGSSVSDDSFPGVESPGTTVTLNAGAYSVNEIELPGYAKTLGVNCSGSIAIGESKTCTITNDDISPTLTLVKTVVNDNGGDLQVSQVPLFISGSPAISGTAYNVPSNTLITASETQQTGYLASVWGTDCAANGTITLLPGENKTCTITNNDIAPTLTFIKRVYNNYGGTLGVSSFPLFINGIIATSGVTYQQTAGVLNTLTETQQYGYEGGIFSGDCASDGTITLSVGENKTCIISNYDIQPKLTVTKVVTNNNGGTKVVADFPLFVDATGVTSGVQNGFNAGTYTVSETTSTGYTSTITGDCAPNGSVTLAVGDVKRCTITNDDQPGTLIVNKVVINNNGGSAVPSNFAYQINGATAVSFEADGSNSQIVNSGNYSITEPAVNGYTTSYNNCEDVFVPNGGSATCTITNDDQQASITVVKVVTNNNGGSALPNSFNLTLGGNPVLSGVTVPVNPGTYRAGETLLSGYTFEGFTGDCDSNGDTTVALGQSKTCTLTNNDQQSYVVVNKTVVNNNGGSSLANDFNLTVDGNAVLDEVAYPVNPGVHTAGETLLPGYTASVWGADCNGVGSVTVALGETKTCSITNDDQQAYITLTKVVTNNNGGNAQPNDFNLTLEGSAVLSGVTVPVNPGTYTAGETLLPGYSFTGFSGDCNTRSGDITVALGQSKSCTLTNDDNAPSLTLIKQVTNNNGGTAVPTDWTLTASGYDTSSPDAGTYNLSESGPAGYTQTSLTCDNAQGQVTSVTLGLGESVTCTFVNDDNAPALTLVKIVTNNNGGNAVASNWTLTAAGPTGFSGVGPSVSNGDSFDAGTYDLSELGLSGYTASAWVCVGGTQNGASISLALGQSVTCTITNDDIAPQLTLIKSVTNDNGGNAAPDDFALTVGGTGVLSGVKNTYNANQAYALNETLLNGYTFTSLTGDAKCPAVLGGTITLDEGDDITCTITNDDIAPTITLSKVVLGGSATVNDFGLTIGATSVSSGQTLTVYSNTPYSLNEAGLTGYSFTSLSGDAKCPAVLGGTVTLNEDEDLSCTITNTRDTGTLIIHKLIDRDGSNTTTDDRFDGVSWTVDVDGSGNDTSNPDNQLTSSLGSATFSSLKTGQYSVLEIQQFGYVLIDAYCDQEEGNLDGETLYSVDLGKNQTMHCTFVNAPNSTLHGYKWHDLNNNGFEDEIGTKLSGWTITLSKDNGEGYEFVSSMVTDDEDHFGWYWFEHLFPGTYKICETGQAGWLQTFPTANSGCHIVTLPAGSSGDVLGEEVQNATFGVPYNFGNVEYSTVTVTKYNDENGNGNWDEGEDVLSDWGMNLVEEEESSMQDSTDEDGQVVFNNVLPGDYILSEDLQEGWNQTNISCSSDGLNESRLLRQLDNDNSHDISVRAGSEITCEVGNQAEPVLRIQKSNDATGAKNPGDIVTYTLVVDLLEGSDLSDVSVTDVTPDGFDYIPGSWTADLNSSPLALTEPNYASPGVWNLGDMSVGDVVTLTYQAKISTDQDGGTYNDLAWAEGSSEGWGTVLALGHDSEYVDSDETFVGTDVEVTKSIQETGTVDIERIGEVLGASTELPATGANTNWLFLALTALITGLFLIFGGKRMQKATIGTLAFMAVFTLTSVTPAMAADNMTVRIETPSSPTRLNEWKLSFSVLDRDYGTPVVNCFVKKPSSVSFVGFGATHTSSKTMGDNGNCQVDSSVMSEQGDYQFYVTAVSGSYSENSSTVTVKYDTSGPGTPGNFSKEHPSSCKWIIKFHTANDGGATTRVEIYSSDQRNFDTHSGTRVGTVSIGSDQDGSFTHERSGDCDREWYYVIRAFDSAGNQSGHVGDQVTINSTVSSSPTTTTAALVTTSTSGSVLGKADSEDGEQAKDGEVLGEESSTSAETVEGNGLIESAKEVAQKTAKNKSFWWIVVTIIALRIVYGISRKEN